MGSISGIGKEWNEQAQSLADYVVGKTIPEVKGISISEEGKPTGADLTASVTMSIEIEKWSPFSLVLKIIHGLPYTSCGQVPIVQPQPTLRTHGHHP